MKRTLSLLVCVALLLFGALPVRASGWLAPAGDPTAPSTTPAVPAAGAFEGAGGPVISPEAIRQAHSHFWKAPPPPPEGSGGTLVALQAQEPPPDPTLTVEVELPQGWTPEVIPVGTTLVTRVRVLRPGAGGALEPVTGAHVEIAAWWCLPDGEMSSGFEPREAGVTGDDGYVDVALSPQRPGIYCILAFAPPEDGSQSGSWGFGNLFALPTDGSLGVLKIGFSGDPPAGLSDFVPPPWAQVFIAPVNSDGEPIFGHVFRECPAMLVPANLGTRPVLLQYNLWGGSGYDGWAHRSVLLGEEVALPGANVVSEWDINLSSLYRLDVSLNSDPNVYLNGTVYVRLKQDAGWTDVPIQAGDDGLLAHSLFILGEAGDTPEVILAADSGSPDYPDLLVRRSASLGDAVNGVVDFTFAPPRPPGDDVYQLSFERPTRDGVALPLRYGGTYGASGYPGGVWFDFETGGEPLYLSAPGEGESLRLLYGEVDTTDDQGAGWSYWFSYYNAEAPSDARDTVVFTDGAAEVSFGQAPLTLDPYIEVSPYPYVLVENSEPGYRAGDQVDFFMHWYGGQDGAGNWVKWESEEPSPARWSILVEKQAGDAWQQVATLQPDAYGGIRWQVPSGADAPGLYRLTPRIYAGPLYGDVDLTPEEIPVVARGAHTVVTVRPDADRFPIRVGDPFWLSVWAEDVPGTVYRGLSGFDVTMPFDRAVVDVVDGTWTNDPPGEDGPWFAFDETLPVPAELTYDGNRGLFRFVRYKAGNEPNVYGSGMLVRWQMTAKGPTQMELFAAPASGTGEPWAPVEVDLVGYDLETEQVYDIPYVSLSTDVLIVPSPDPVEIRVPADGEYIPSGWFSVAGTGNPYGDVTLTLTPSTGPSFDLWGWADHDGNWQAWPDREVPDGACQIVAGQSTEWGDTVTSDPVTVTVDSLPPVVQLRSVSDVEGGKLVAGAVYETNLRDLWAFVHVTPGTSYTDLDSEESADGPVRKITPGADGSFTFTVPGDVASVIILARDKAGHQASVSALQIAPPPPPPDLHLEVIDILFPNDSTAEIPTNARMVVWFIGTPGRDANGALQNGVWAYLTSENGEQVDVAVTGFGGDTEGKAALLTPARELAPNTSYTLTITAKTDAQPPVAVVPFSLTFATGNGPDKTPPSLQAVVPSASTGVAVDTEVALTFDELLNPLSYGFELYEGTQIGTNPVTKGSGFRNEDFTTVHLWPASDLKPGTTYTWAAWVEDLCGNKAGTPQSPLAGTFSTAGGDSQPPTVTSRQPEPGQTGVAIDTNVVITFSEPMKTGASEFSFSLRAQGSTTDVPGNGSWNAARTVYTFDPAENLQYNTQYTVNLSGQDDAGNAMTDSFSFTTVPPPATETVAPSILPAQQTLGVGASGSVRVHLDGVTSQMNLTAATVELKYDPGKLRVTSFETGALLSGGIPVGPNHDATTGTIVFSISRPTSPATGPGDLLLIHFQTLQEGATEFRFFDVTGQSGGDGIEVINASDQEILTSTPSNAQINVISGGTLSGRVLLQGRYNQSTMQPIRDHSGIKIEVLGAGIDPVYTQADGTFSVVLPAGTYPVMISRSQYLRQLVQVTITAGATTDLSTAVGHDVILLAGDIDGDAYNRVYTSDLQALARAFGSNSTTQTGNWNAAADLDGNGAVYTSDLQLLARNFGKRGDAYPAP